MVALGSAALLIAFLTALFATAAALWSARTGEQTWLDASRRAIYAIFGLLLIAVVGIEYAFVTSDFSREVVATHSSTTTPLGYKLTAMWGSQSGSLLLWAFTLSAASSAVLALTRFKHREILPWATAVLAGLIVFFTGMMVAGIAFPDADSWPFEALAVARLEGSGLNPLLRHPAMAIHPPMLYAGYVFFTIPFAFAIGALIARKVDASWIRSTRRFALIAWTFLSAGLILGAFWSYNELGWGGYWAWDPVENAALMPWLTGTAFLHSIMVQERRGMLKVWNVSLIVATFALSLIGTFLVRSGVLQSIHAFGESKVGPPLLVLIITVILGSAWLISNRLDDLRSERRIDSLASREAMFLINNLLFVGMAVVVFWLTFFPIVSDAITGTERNIGAPIYNSLTTPIAIGLVFLAGVGPIVAWRRISLDAARRVLTVPLAFMVVATVGLILVADAGRQPVALVLFAVGSFTLAAITQEFLRAAQARKSLSGGRLLPALSTTVMRNRRRYGGYFVHIGIAVLLAGVAASSSFQTSRDVRLNVGEQTQVGDYTVTYRSVDTGIDVDEQKITFGAFLDVTRDGEAVGTVKPAREYFSSPDSDSAAPVRSFFEGQATSEVGKQSGAVEDLWTAMQPDLSSFDGEVRKADEALAIFAEGLSQQENDLVRAQGEQELAQLQGRAILSLIDDYEAAPPPVDFRINVNPFVTWVWIGGGFALIGALFGLWPGSDGRRRKVSDVYAARLAQELSRA